MIKARHLPECPCPCCGVGLDAIISFGKTTADLIPVIGEASVCTSCGALLKITEDGYEPGTQEFANTIPPADKIKVMLATGRPLRVFNEAAFEAAKLGGCAVCGHTVQRIGEKERIFWCPRCGALKRDGDEAEACATWLADRAAVLVQILNKVSQLTFGEAQEFTVPINQAIATVKESCSREPL